MNLIVRKFLSRIYFRIPFKKQLFVLLKRYFKFNSSLTHYMRFKGIVFVPLDKNLSFKMYHYGFEIENSLFWYGLNGWEKYSLNIWSDLSKLCNCVFDIGSNTGVYALLSKTINPTSSVYAFEPVKRVYEKLVENIRLNNYNIISIEKAVSNFDGEAVIFDPGTEQLYSVTVNRNLNDARFPVKKVPIETISLNTFIRENNIKSVDLMKIDVETHEPEVLNGFSEYFATFLPIILIEILNEEVGAKINQYVATYDYACYNIDENKGCLQEQMIRISNNRNYLLVPRCKISILNEINFEKYLYRDEIRI